jgi:hypothetical protein
VNTGKDQRNNAYINGKAANVKRCFICNSPNHLANFHSKGSATSSTTANNQTARSRPILSATVKHAVSVDNERNAKSEVNKSSDIQQQSSAGSQLNCSAPAPQDSDIIACVSDIMIETPVPARDVFDCVYEPNHYDCLSGVDRIDCANASVDGCTKSEDLKALDLAPLRYVSVQVGDGNRFGKNVKALYDTGAEIPLAHSSVLDGLNVRKCGSVNIRSAVGESVKCDLC